MVGAQKKKHVTIDEDYTENLLLNLEKQKKEPCGGRQDVWDGFAYKTSEELKKYDFDYWIRRSYRLQSKSYIGYI